MNSWMTDELHVSAFLAASPMSSLVSFDGRYGQRKLSSNLEYQRTTEFQHSLTARVARDEDILLFQAVMNVNLDPEHKIVSLDIQSGRHITLDAQLGSTTAEIRFFWDKDADPSRYFEFSGRLTQTSGHVQVQCVARPPVRIQFDRIGNSVKVHATWRGNQAITLLLDRNPGRTSGQLSTPFSGFEQITFDAEHECTSSEIDAQVGS